jgi:hypothetical protein
MVLGRCSTRAKAPPHPIISEGKHTEMVEELHEEIEALPEKKVRMQFRTVLRRMGLRNRVKSSLKSVQISRTKRGIAFEFSDRSSDSHVDHIKSFSHGGLTVVDNLQLLHITENLRKGARRL